MEIQQEIMSMVIAFLLTIISILLVASMSD